MSEGSKRSDDESDDALWNDFENCAQSVVLLYRDPSWKSLQTAAASTTLLYKSGLERKKKAYERGYSAGRQTLAREIYALRRYNMISIDDIWKYLTKIISSTEHGYTSRSPTPEQTDSPAVSFFQQALCIAPTVGCPPPCATELNSFLTRQVYRRRKRNHHSPMDYPFRKASRSQ